MYTIKYSEYMSILLFIMIFSSLIFQTIDCVTQIMSAFNRVFKHYSLIDSHNKYQLHFWLEDLNWWNKFVNVII